MDKVGVNVFFAQRGADRELDARNDICLRFVLLPRNGGFSFSLHVAPHAAVYRNVQNPSNGADHHVRVQVGFQLRTLRVVTRGASAIDAPSCRCASARKGRGPK